VLVVAGACVPLLQGGHALSQADVVNLVEVNVGVRVEDRAQRLSARLMLAYNLVNSDSDSDNTFLVNSFLLFDKHAQAIILKHVH